MLKLSLRLLLLITLGFLFIKSYSSLISNIKQQYETESKQYIARNENLQSRYQELLEIQNEAELNQCIASNEKLQLENQQQFETQRDAKSKEHLAVEDKLQSQYHRLLKIQKQPEFYKKHGNNNFVRNENVSQDASLVALHETQTNLLSCINNEETPEVEITDRKNIETLNQSRFAELETLKHEISFNNMKAAEVAGKKDSIWLNLPPCSAIITSAIGIFLSTLIVNLANTCYSSVSLMLNKFRRKKEK